MRVKSNRTTYNPLIPNTIMVQERDGREKYELIYRNPLSHREFKSVLTNMKDVSYLVEYWKQRYKLLNDIYDKDYLDNQLIKINQKGTDNKILNKIEEVDLYKSGYLIAEGVINLNNGFISDINVHFEYDNDNLIESCLVMRRTHKSFTFKEKDNTLQCKLITPLKYCKTIIKKNYTDRLIKWCKKARIIHLSVYNNQVD